MQRTLADEIISIVKDYANDNQAPIKCEVIKNYSNDITHIDVSTEEGTFSYVPCLISNKVGRKGVLLFLNGNLEEPLAIIDSRDYD